MASGSAGWRERYEASQLREAEFTTMSGVPVEAVYGPDAGEFPGEYPYTRGPYARIRAPVETPSVTDTRHEAMRRDSLGRDGTEDQYVARGEHPPHQPAATHQRARALKRARGARRGGA